MVRPNFITDNSISKDKSTKELRSNTSSKWICQNAIYPDKQYTVKYRKTNGDVTETSCQNNMSK